MRLARRNVLRHKARSISIIAAVAFGTAGLALSQGFIEDVFVQLAEAIVHSQSGHIQLATGGYYSYGAHQPDKFLVTDPDGDKKKIASLSQVNDVMARLSFSGLLNNGKADLAVIGEGIEPAKEEKLSSFLKLSAGRRLAAQDQYTAIVGHGVAKSLGLKPGDRVVLVVSTSDGAMNTLDLEIVGVFQTFSKAYDDRAVKVPLAAAQELLNTRSVNTLVISLNHTHDTHDVASILTERTLWRNQEIRTWDQLNDFYPKTVRLYQQQFGGLRVIILLMIVLSVINAVNTSVFERTAEFGTARALGNRSPNVFLLVIAENIILGLVGAGVGLALTLIVTELVARVGIPMPPPPNADLPYTAFIRLTFEGLFTASLISVGATFLAAIVPAFQVSRMPVVNALRQGI